jgi:hypothetical protein
MYPRLNSAPLRPSESQPDQRHRLGLGFAEGGEGGGRALVTVHQALKLLGVPEEHVGQLMKERLVRQLRDRRDRDFATTRVSLDVAVRVVERDALN